MAEMRVRSATSADLEAVLAMYEWLFASPGTKPPGWDPERARHSLAEAIASERSAILLAVPERRPAGLCSVYLDLESVRFGRRAWVEDLAVDPQLRSRGIGAALLETARSWARERGATHLELDTGEARRDAQRFYERERPSWRSISYAWEL